MDSDSSSVPTPPEGEWSDGSGASPLDSPRILLPPHPGILTDQYLAHSRPESLVSSSSSIPTPPEGGWSDGNGAASLDPRIPYSDTDQLHSSAGLQLESPASNSSSVPSPPEGEWSDTNMLDLPSLLLQPHGGTRHQDFAANSDQSKSSSFSCCDSQSLYEEPGSFLVHVNAKNNDTNPENSQNDYDGGFLDHTQGKVSHLMLQKLAQVHSHSEVHFGNPEFWCHSYKTIQTLGPNSIIDASIIDFCISSGVLGAECGRQAYYLDQVMINNILVNHMLTDKVRGVISPGTTGNLPVHPILFLHKNSPAHYYLIALNFALNEVLVLDREFIHREHGEIVSWDRWQGEMLWKSFAEAFGWPCDRNVPYVREIDWVEVCMHDETSIWFLTLSLHQPGPDGSPDLVSAALHFKLKGWPARRWARPNLRPTKHVRMDIFETVLRRSFDGFKAWERHHKMENYRVFPPLLIREELRMGPCKFQAIVSLDMMLQQNILAPHRQQPDVRPPIRRQVPVREVSVESGDRKVVEEGVSAVVDPTFDEYHTAPPQETDRTSTAGTYTFLTDGILQRDRTWSQWRDRGLRIVPDFHAVFPKAEPTSYHTDQTINIHPDSSSWSDSDVISSDATLPHEQHNPLESILPRELPSMGNRVDLGLQDMLDEAGVNVGTVQSQNVFLMGKECSGNDFMVCPERDSVFVDPSSIARKMDIDSLIWVGRHVQFRSACHIALTPSLGYAPPFAKSNHVFVRLLLPPTQAEWDNYKIGSTSKIFNLSQIPHMHFGHIGEGDTRFNIIIFFPRMTFKPVGYRFMQTLIPRVIQELWLTECVMAALHDTFTIYPTTQEYIPTSVQEINWRLGGDRKPSTLTLTPATLASLQGHLAEKVKATPHLLSRFGSFFFAVDTRGFKILSKQHGWDNGAAVTVQNMLPSLDIDYMMDREKGELILDMGVSYHAESLGAEQVVGLWKLPVLKERYERMGFRKPLTHHINTLSALGGMQGKARKSAMNSQHILSRLSYNLAYQVIRAPGTAEYLTNVDNAIQGNRKFVDACQRWEMLFSTASGKGYGVRDEIRASAKAIFNMLDSAGEEVIFPSLTICVSYSIDCDRWSMTGSLVLYCGSHHKPSLLGLRGGSWS